MYNDLQERVCNAIDYKMTHEDVPASFFAREIHYKLKLSEPAAISYISYVRRGAMYGDHSDLRRKRPDGIKRLAILLYAIGFDVNNPIVTDLRRYDTRFEYPPRNAIPYIKIREKFQNLRQRKSRILPLDKKIGLLSGPKRARVREFVDDLLQQTSPS